jgi:hypothetical protein
MKTRQRVSEAIKQTELALENIDNPDTRQKLEQGLDSLKLGLKSLKEGPGR